MATEPDARRPEMMLIPANLRNVGRIGEIVAKHPKGSQHQAKHFQPEDHAHAAHQEQARRGNARKPGHDVEKNWKKKAGETGHPVEQTPRGPRKGQ